MNIRENKYSNVPEYMLEQLRKGIICERCNSFSVFVSGYYIQCNNCGNNELTSSAILRSIKEFNTLFPNHKVTTNLIHDWCRVIPSKKRIQRVLDKNFKIVGSHQWSYYI